MVAASQRVTNEQLQTDLGKLHAEVMNLSPRLTNIEKEQKSFGLELAATHAEMTAMRQDMGELKKYQREANGCMAKMQTDIAVLEDHDKAYTDTRKAEAGKWWDVVKIPLGIGIGAFLTWVMSGGLRVP